MWGDSRPRLSGRAQLDLVVMATSSWMESNRAFGRAGSSCPHIAIARRLELLLLFLLRLPGQRRLEGLARQHLVAHRSLVHKAGDDNGCLLQIVGLKAVIDVHVGVVGTRLVLNWILDELESRNPNRVERKMIRPSRVAHGESRHPETF